MRSAARFIVPSSLRSMRIQLSLVAMAKKKMASDDDAAMSTPKKTRKKKIKEEEAEMEESSLEVEIEPITFVPVIETIDESVTSVLEEAAKRPTKKRTRGKPPPELLEEEDALDSMALRQEEQYGFGSMATEEGKEDAAAPLMTKGFGLKPGSIVSQEVIDILEAVEPPPESERPIYLPLELQVIFQSGRYISKHCLTSSFIHSPRTFSNRSGQTRTSTGSIGIGGKPSRRPWWKEPSSIMPTRTSMRSTAMRRLGVSQG